MKRATRATVGACTAALFVLVAGPNTYAEDTSANSTERPANLDKPAERRSGLVVGTMGGAGLAGSSGYPNDPTKINDADYYSASGLMAGTGGSFFIMGAIADYLNFGFWFGGGTFTNRDWHSAGGGIGLRVEAFPLYSLVPRLKDLGVFGQFGIGFTTLDSKVRSNVSADGAESFIGVGVFYEFPLFRMLGGHVAAGPGIEYDAITSRSIERHWAMLGGRIAFYGGP